MGMLILRDCVVSTALRILRSRGLMAPLTKRVVGVVSVLLLTVCAQSASAGLIPVWLEEDRISAGPVVSTCGSFTTDESPHRDPGRSPPLPDLAVVALPWEAPSTGTSAGVSSTAQVVAAFAFVDTAICASEGIVAYLAEHPDLKVPVPFLDGIFRPPRQVVSL